MQLLTIKEITKLLQISRPQLYFLMKREFNPIPFTRVGESSPRFSDLKINSWIEHTCPHCEHAMEREMENNGFSEPEGSSHWEATGDLHCPECGAVKK